MTYVPFEYAVGKRWANRAFVFRPDGVQLAVSTEFAIETRERITVPAGTFDAYRVLGRSLVHGQQGVTQFRLTHWMVPDKVRVFVLREEHRSFQGRPSFAQRTELAAYKQG